MQAATLWTTQGDVRHFLLTCRHAVLEIASLRQQMEAVRLPDAPCFRSASIVELRSRDNHPVATALNRLDHYDTLLAAKIDSLEQQLSCLEAVLCALEDGKSRAIARYYYGQAWTDARIAEAVEMDERSIRRKRGLIVKQLERRFG